MVSEVESIGSAVSRNLAKNNVSTILHEELAVLENNFDEKNLENLKSLESIAIRLSSIETALSAIENSRLDEETPEKLVDLPTLSEDESGFTNEFGEDIEQASVRLCAENDNSAAHGFVEEADLILIQAWDLR